MRCLPWSLTFARGPRLRQARRDESSQKDAAEWQQKRPELAGKYPITQEDQERGGSARYQPGERYDPGRVLGTPLAEVEAKSSNRQEDRENYRHHHEAAVDAVFRIVSAEPETNDAEHNQRAEITCECEERSHSSSGCERTDHDVVPIRITECDFHGAGIWIQMRLLLQSRDKRAGPKQRLVEVVHTKEQE